MSDASAADAKPDLTTEAGVYHIDKLTEDQWRAVERLLAHLAHEAGKPAEKKPAASQPCGAFLARVGPPPPSNILLIDGDRGSGKTSVLFTLLEVLVRRCDNQPDVLGTRTDPPRVLPRRPAARIVPLGVVDLQALPHATHVLLHVLRKVESLITALERDGCPTPPAWARSASEAPSARQAWERLKKAALLGWQDDGMGSGRVDPETYIFERLDAEDARLTLPDAFREFIDALIADTKRAWGVKDEPLFVLPIDDADMNPHLSVRLLHLLRLLYHRRFFFLVTGHSKQFLGMLSLDMLARVFRPLAGTGLTPEPEAHWQQAQRLAGQWYAKAVPHDSRAPLPGLRAHDRLRIFKELLGDRPMPLQPLAPVPGVAREKATLLHYIEGLEATREALPDSLRGLVALAQRLRDSSVTDATRAKEGVLAMWADARERTLVVASGLDAAVEARLEIKPPTETTEPGAGADTRIKTDTDERKPTKALTLHVDGSALRLELEPAFWCPGRIERDTPVPPATDTRFAAEDMRATFFLANRARLKLGDTPLDARLGGALVLAAWVALDGDDDRAGGIDARWESFVQITLPTDEHGERLRFNWPLPRWQWPDTLLFAQGWYARVRALPYGVQRDTRDMAAVFMDLVARVALERDASFDAQAAARQRAPDPEELAARVLAMSEPNPKAPDDERSETHRRWLREGALLLAAPESGLSREWGARWAAALRNAAGDSFPEWVDAARAQRLERAARALVTAGIKGTSGAQALKRLLDDLDASFYSWEELVAAPMPPTPSPKRRRRAA